MWGGIARPPSYVLASCFRTPSSSWWSLLLCGCLSSHICSCHAQALGEVSASVTLVTFLCFQTDPKCGQCAATGCVYSLVWLFCIGWLSVFWWAQLRPVVLISESILQWNKDKWHTTEVQHTVYTKYWMWEMILMKSHINVFPISNINHK